MKMINGESIANEDLADELYEICDRVHSSCNDDCPVYKINEGPWGGDNETSVKQFNDCGCGCFKRGWAMFNFIRKYQDTDGM